jgi:putative DNA primase/helicase
MIVRKQGYDNDFLYWYENGCYKKSSPNGFKGKIKKHIPEDIRKANHFEEVYKELITDTTGIKFEDLNDARGYINVKNGLYNVKTKTLEKHDPKLLSTIQLNCDYDPKAKEPIEWFKFINMLAEGDKNIIAILQEWFGLTLSNIPGSITKKCLSLHGPLGNTGKTQYGNMLIHLLNSDNICSTPIQDFSKTFATGDLYGAKAVVIDDQKSVNIDDSSTFKSITGGGFIRCEQKGKQAFPYEFKGTLTFSCNDLPYFKGDKGDHLFERFIIVPCNNVISEDKRIGDIIERFKLETNGIFQWALEGLNRLIDNNYKFTHSDICSTALEEYKFANDSFYKFIKENYTITFDKKDCVKKTSLEDEYIRWAFSNEIQSLDKKNISARALKHGIGYGKSMGGWYYKGIKRNLLTEIGDEIPF